MSTTTIRIPDELKARLSRIAAQQGTSTHGLILDAIAEAHADKIDIVKLNVDEFPDLAIEYNILGIPAMKVFKGGEVVKSIVGAKPRPALEQDLAEFIG